MRWTLTALAGGLVIMGAVAGARAAGPASSYLPVVEEPLPAVMARMRAAKAEIEQRQRALLQARYDLADRPIADATMSRGKAIQDVHVTPNVLQAETTAIVEPNDDDPANGPAVPACSP